MTALPALLLSVPQVELSWLPCHVSVPMLNAAVMFTVNATSVAAPTNTPTPLSGLFGERAQVTRRRGDRQSARWARW